jgi:alkanesulfonate monooxygenase SsuD/methylene tetrahydromethanopterin reductase-like flavin-dependent oxidoreductase (luciferase family)
VKHLGFLSFGHWQNAPWSRTRTAADAHRQTIELAEAAEALGIDGAFVRVHHWAPQLASPFPAAIGARTSRIEIGTAVIDMRYENPLYMAEDAAAADLIAGGRLQLGISRGSARWAGEQGMNLMSSTLLLEDTGVPFDELQAEQIAIFRDAWAATGWSHDPRVSVSRSVIPIVTDEDRTYFGGRSGEDRDQLGYLDGAFACFGRSYTGEPDVIADELARDVAVQAADTILLTVPNQLGVEYNARLLETIVREIAPAIGWQSPHDRVGA